MGWCNWVRFVGLLARTCFFSSAHKFSMGLRSGLCYGHSNTSTLLSLSHFVTTLEVCLGSLSIWKTNLRPSFNFLTDILRCCFNISTSFPIYFVKCTSPSCSKAHSQHDAATPRASRLGWCSSACKPPPLFSKHIDGHYGQTVLFLFHQTRGHFSKKYHLSPPV